MVHSDQKWFDDIYTSTISSVRRYVLCLYRAFPWFPYDPDDIIQEVYLCLYDKKDEIYDAGGIKPWLIKVAQNKTLTVGRKHIDRMNIINDYADTERIENTAAKEIFDFKKYMEICENEIGKDNLETFQRYYIDKEDIGKIARENGVSIPVMRMRFHRWKKYCARAIKATAWLDLIIVVGMFIHKRS